MREVILDVRHYGEPEYEASIAHPSVTMRSVSSMTGQGPIKKRIVELEGPSDDIAGFVFTLREHPSVVDVDPLMPPDTSPIYVAVAYDSGKKESMSSVLSGMGIHYRTGTTITGGVERWILYLDPDEDLSGVIRTMEGSDNDVTLVRNVPLSDLDRPPQLSRVRFFDDLTRRQREVLTTAIERGYYEHDGGVGIDDVAEALDLGSTTVWEHLSRAESKVMTQLREELSS
ncbi:helix-turn-helix domain-containing protein [Halorubrum vacuolatum]|uniref:Predicted DNA binding protein, contains HTH domain n=1 Tax=Halorubrum vacuolatum TaxID=63740 RepID=A0A238URK2_HALVU|nr:helix-turn-helix domain-containing protein [Halorubrum vacuolatum]SNR24591.1 Predicted DNA binding protein, contains HTH domain [Halorubrum vacuolatum]